MGRTFAYEERRKMRCRLRRGWVSLAFVALLGAEPGQPAVQVLRPRLPASGPPTTFAEEAAPGETGAPECVAGVPPVAFVPPAPAACDRPLPINLPAALRLAGVRPIDIALASQRVGVALAALERARVAWLPTVTVGLDYFRHDGRIQDVAGNVFDTSKSSLMFGAGSGIGQNAVISVTDAIFGPLAARQVVAAREAGVQIARNDTLLAVAEAYFNVQQARGELAGAEDAVRRAEDLLRRIEELAKTIVTGVEVVRTRAELARRRQAVQSARERWRVASADLARVLRLDPAALVEPLEPPHLRVTLVGPGQCLDDLIALGLTNRPELAAQQALVRATLERLRQERLRPLIPSVLLRGAATPVTGTLAAGVFGGGINASLNHFGLRNDIDLQVLWEFQNLGFGNRALVHERLAENQLAVLELFAVQDRVAAEVAQAHAQVVSAAARVAEAEAGLRDAVESAEKNLQGLRQTKAAGGLLLLVVRPQEAVASVQALAQAYNDYYGAVADYDRAQFRLYRALGQPAQRLADPAGGCAPGAPQTAPVPGARPAVLPPAGTGGSTKAHPPGEQDERGPGGVNQALPGRAANATAPGVQR